MKSFKRLYESTERLVQDVKIVNNETLEQVTGALKRVIKKWKSGRQLSNGALFIPVFSLESKEEKYKEIVKQKHAKDYVKYERPDSDELPFTYLSVTILAFDYFAAEKARKKGLDNEYVRTLRNQIDEYHAINKELEDDLKSIRGLVLSGYGLGKKQKGKQFDTSSYLFYIDPKLIDINELSKHFITSNDRYDSVKKRLARECFLKDKNGYFVYDGVPYGTYKTRKMDLDIDEKLKMTNIKRENKTLYEQIMKNVSRELKRTLNEDQNVQAINEIPLYQQKSKEAKTVIRLILNLIKLDVNNGYYHWGKEIELAKKFFGPRLDHITWTIPCNVKGLDKVKGIEIRFDYGWDRPSKEYGFGKVYCNSKTMPMTDEQIQNIILYLKDLIKLRKKEIKEAQKNPQTEDEFYQLMVNYGNTIINSKYIVRFDNGFEVYYKNGDPKDMFSWKGGISLKRNEFNEYTYTASTPLAGSHGGSISIDSYKEVVDDYLKFIRVHK